MKKLWADLAWDDYLYWQTHDKKTLKRINDLVKSIERDALVQKSVNRNRFVIEKRGVEELMM